MHELVAISTDRINARFNYEIYWFVHNVLNIFFGYYNIVVFGQSLSKFNYQPIHKRNALKGVLKLTLKMLQHVSV